MYWLPTFSNWAPAAIAAGVAIPSLLLLYFLKLRRREMQVPSTILWKKAVQDLQVNSPFQRLRRNLLLLLQMLILAALLLALSNPITFYKPGATDNTVILIDRSASMNARDAGGLTRLEEAKRRAIELIDTMGRGARAMVIAFDDSAETVQPFSSDLPALKQAISAIQPTDRPSRLKLAYQLADAQMNVNPDEVASAPTQRIFLYSDGRASDQSELSLRGDLRYEPIGDAKSKNIGIVAFSARRNYDRPTEVQIFARLANFGPEPVEADVQLSVSTIDADAPAVDKFEVRQARSSLRLLPERWTEKQREDADALGRGASNSVEFTLELATAGVIKLEQMNRADDVLSQDDTALVVVPPPKVLSVALVTDGNYFLERAVSSLNLQKPQVFAPADWELKRPADVDVILFDRYVPKYMPVSGNYIWFGALPGDLQIKQSKDAQGRGQFLTDVEILDWKRDHAMLRHLSLGKLFVAEALQLDVPLQSEILIEGTAGPLLVMHRENRSTHLVCAFDVLQSNWPLRVSFPLFLHNALQYVAIGADLNVRESFRPGATPKIPRTNLDRAVDGAREITLITSSGSRRLPIPAAGDFAVPSMNQVGLYRFDPIVPQYERLAVNLLDENESNTFPLEKSPGDIGQTVKSDGGRSPLQLWWWILACGGVPLLMIEWWVYTRRVHS
ncbi:MAG: VWA domain-containing protein [Burkholderiales bacterium]|nr:VWA domain-containing protein [Phycisphaerae bacterium]